MSTLDGAILRVMADDKPRTAKEIRQAILDRSTLYEGDIPKSTLWYHLLSLRMRHKISTMLALDGRRVLYARRSQ
jgi:hypothetical protein